MPAIPESPPAPAPIRTKVWMTWHIVALVIAGLIVVLMVVGGVFALLRPPPEEEEFRVGAVQCRIVDGTTAYLALPLTPLHPERMKTVYLDKIVGVEVALTGVSLMALGYDLSAASESVLEQDFLDGVSANEYLDVESVPGTVLLRLSRTEATAQVESVVLWIGYGEPAAQQTIPVDVTWNDSTCEVGK